MTLILGIKCKNGVVIGSDSAATSAIDLGPSTSMQPTTKLSIFDKKVIIGVSGPVSLGQFFENELSNGWNNRVFSDKSTEEVRIIITELFRTHLKRELAFLEQAAKVFGNQIKNGIMSNTLIAIPIKNKPILLGYDFKADSTEYNDKLPLIAIGIGQLSADPFLAFLRRAVCKDGEPSIEVGKMIAYWTLNYCIKSSPGGIGLGISLAILEKNANAELNAFMVSDAEMSEYGQHIQEIEDNIKENMTMNSKGIGDIPKPN